RRGHERSARGPPHDEAQFPILSSSCPKTFRVISESSFIRKGLHHVSSVQPHHRRLSGPCRLGAVLRRYPRSRTHPVMGAVRQHHALRRGDAPVRLSPRRDTTSCPCTWLSSARKATSIELLTCSNSAVSISGRTRSALARRRPTPGTRVAECTSSTHRECTSSSSPARTSDCSRHSPTARRLTLCHFRPQ